jgi:hypothetical protein
MKLIVRCLIGAALSSTFHSTASAVSTFGAFTRGSDLEPVSAFLEDGGEGSASASVNFTTFRAEAGFDPSSTYLPVLKAESTGLDATFDDDRTQAVAQAYQVFTSTVAQTIVLDITLNSVVTNGADGTSGVLSNVYVYGGSNFAVQDGFCSGGRFTFGGIYLCGDEIATSSRNGLDWSNLFNGGTDPTLTDSLSFTVAAGEAFGIFGDLSAGSFQGTADAFNTLTLGFGDDTFITAVTIPSAVPLPAAAWLFISGLLGILGIGNRKRSS